MEISNIANRNFIPVEFTIIILEHTNISQSGIFPGNGNQPKSAYTKTDSRF